MTVPSISTLRSLAGAAYKTWCVSGLNGTYSPGQTFTLDDTASWQELDPTTLQPTGNPLGTTGPFMVILDAGTLTEEKIRCSSVNLTTGVVTVWTDGTNNGRGAEGSQLQTHPAQASPPGTLNCYPCIEAGLLLQLQKEVIALIAGEAGYVESVNAGTGITISGPLTAPTVNVTAGTFDAAGAASTAQAAAIATAETFATNAVAAETTRAEAAEALLAPKASPTFTGIVTLAQDPAAALQAATKQYVDAVASGLDVKPSVLACAATNVASLSGAQTIDGVSATAGSRVLLTGQSTTSQNGLWVVNAGAWTRPVDFASGSSQIGSFTFVEQGTANTGAGFTMTGAAVTVDTNAQTWTQFSGAGATTAGTGLTKSGNTISITGVITAGSAGDATHTVALTYNAQGQITAATATLIQISESQVTNLTSDLATKIDTAGTGLSKSGTTLSMPNTGTAGAQSPKVTTDAQGRVISSAALTAGDIPNIAESQVTNLTSDLVAKAPLASPALTGNPTAPTQTAGDNSTKIATTQYADSADAVVLSTAETFATNAVATEATARIAGDAASVSTAETFATNAVSAEATTRAAGDATNAAAIAAETTRAEAAEALLLSEIPASALFPPTSVTTFVGSSATPTVISTGSTSVTFTFSSSIPSGVFVGGYINVVGVTGMTNNPNGTWLVTATTTTTVTVTVTSAPSGAPTAYGTFTNISYLASSTDNGHLIKFNCTAGVPPYLFLPASAPSAPWGISAVSGNSSYGVNVSPNGLNMNGAPSTTLLNAAGVSGTAVEIVSDGAGYEMISGLGTSPLSLAQNIASYTTASSSFSTNTQAKVVYTGGMGGIATLTGSTYGQTVVLVNEGTSPLAVVPGSGYTLTHKAVNYTSTSPLWVPVGGAATFVQFGTVFYPTSANFATLAPQAQAVPATQNYIANYLLR